MRPSPFGQDLTRSTSNSGAEYDDEVIFSGRRAAAPGPDDPRDQAAGISEGAVSISLGSQHTIITKKNLKSRHLKRTRDDQRLRRHRSSPGDSAIDDYASNLLDHETDGSFSANMFLSLRDLGGSDHMSSESEDLENFQNDLKGPALDHGFGISSALDAEQEQCARIVARRVRRNEKQYLMATPNSATDDAKWVSQAQVLDSDRLHTAVQNFEASCLNDELAYSPDLAEGCTPDEAEIEADLQTALEDLQTEDALAADRVLDLDDEHIARLVAKQEEFGIDATDLVLFDDDGPPKSSRKMAVVDLDSSGRHAELRKSRKGRAFQSKRVSHSALRFQNMVNDRDVVYSPRQMSKKFRASNMDFELSDEELLENMQSAWQKDRSKKKAKKRERGELRSQGLLGKHGLGDVDLKVKYDTGMRLIELKEEIRVFMNGPKQSISLPSMDPQARKSVHEMCHNLGLKSKSMGSGVARFPVLYKSSRTRPFNGRVFDQSRRKFFAAPGRSKKLHGPIERAQLGRAISHGQYHDGEIVGAAAPELGEENRGRVMMEKMGWCKGTNLGATNNPGIAEPVTQVVKRSRAGLG